MTDLKTTIAARELGISYSRLMSLLRADKFPSPHKDSSGDYLWSQQDLEEAKQALSIDRRRKSPGDVSSSPSNEPASLIENGSE